MSKIKYVVKRNGSTVPFTEERITNAIYRAAVSVGGRDRKIAEGLSAQVVEILESKYDPKTYPSVEEIQDVVEKVLIENGHAKVSKAYILYREDRTRRREKEQSRYARPQDSIPWKKVWNVLDWAVAHDLDTVTKLNQRLENGEYPQIVSESEAAYDLDIQTVVKLIKDRENDVRLVTIAGPSSSGKTTTTQKIAQSLGQKGMQFVELNLDNYYYDLELHPKDEFGDYDFETPQSLDIDLINQHLHQLLSGNQVLMPYYDFKTGKSHPEQTSIQLKQGDIILIDSLYGLFPPLTDGIADNKIDLYIEPLMQVKDEGGNYVRWTDIRLMRRMLRDTIHRAYSHEQTLTHWHYVRSGEIRNILPYSNQADFVINSAMPYELPLYKSKLFAGFTEWVAKYADDPVRQDAYTRAARVHKLLDQVLPEADDSVVPQDSVIREFIGGLVLD